MIKRTDFAQFFGRSRDHFLEEISINSHILAFNLNMTWQLLRLEFDREKGDQWNGSID